MQILQSRFLQLFFILTIVITIISCQSGASKNSEDGDAQKSYRKNGSLMSTIEHKDGKRHGLSTGYYNDGKTKPHKTPITNRIIIVNAGII